MRKKGTNLEVCHMWANQAQEEMSNGNGSIYFNGPTIYSYGSHFPIATHVNDNIIFFTIHNYSVTTSNHISKVRQAIPSSKTVFTVDHVTPGITGEYNHTANLKNYDDRFKRLLESASRARSNRPYLLQQAIDLADEANYYASYFGIAWYIETESINLHEIKKQLDIAKKEKAKKEKERKEKLIKLNEQKIKQWKCGENVRLPYEIGFLLRIKNKIIETSQGANIPIGAALKLWPLICRAVKNKKAYNFNDVKLGHYRLDKIEENGNIKVGCHYIKYNELENIAKQLELIK